MVDFIDRMVNERPERCPLSSWWAEFVGNVERIKNLPEECRRKEQAEGILEAIRKAKRSLSQTSRRIWPLIEAFGGAEVVRAIIQVAEPRLTDDDRILAGKLVNWLRYCLPRVPGHRQDLIDLEQSAFPYSARAFG